MTALEGRANASSYLVVINSAFGFVSSLIISPVSGSTLGKGSSHPISSKVSMKHDF